MGHIAGTTFGIGAPATLPVPSISWGVSPYAGQALGAQPFPSQPYLRPFSNQSIAGQGIGAGQPLPQILQFLQIVPQQLQQLIPVRAPAGSVSPAAAAVRFGELGRFDLVPQAFAGQGASYVM